MGIRSFAVSVVIVSGCMSSTDSRSELDQPIIGGGPAGAGQIPSMALVGTDPAVFLDFFAWCGGVVIADRWILTAAHCVDLLPLDFGGERPAEVTDLRIVVNRLRVSQVTAGDMIPVDAYYIHPDFDPRTLDHDVALLRTTVPVAAPSMAILTRPTEHDLLSPGRLATTAGWGTTNPDNIFSSSNQLRSVDVPIVDRATCDALYDVATSLTDVTNDMVCAGDTVAGGVDACVGDSGGPLFIMEAGRQLLAGTVSFGEGCARPEFPGVYARAATEAGWANACISDPAACDTADHALPPIVPELHCVDALGNGDYRAHFGYTSHAALALALAPGLHNRVVGSAPGALPPTVFASGTNADAFTTTFRAATAWWLIGPDGRLRVAVASFASPRCG